MPRAAAAKHPLLGCRLLCLAALFPAVATLAQPLPPGKSQRSVDIDGTAISIHVYKPAAYAGGPLLVSLHGAGRNAAGYRDHAVPLADHGGLLVIAPLFDRARFPSWRYQAGGMVRDLQAAGEFHVEPREQWTGQLLLQLIEAVRAIEGRPDLPYYLLGHSAGAQMLSRLAAFLPNAAQRIVIANPSAYVWPGRGERFPYGFGGLPEALSGDAAIRRYLAQPVTLLLGTEDTRRDAQLGVQEGAERQGANRHQRGLNVFHAARQAALDRGWAFNWRLVEVPGIAHSARAMYSAPETRAAVPAAAP